MATDEQVRLKKFEAEEVHLRLDPADASRLDFLRGEWSRSRWLREALEQALYPGFSQVRGPGRE